MLPIKHVKKMFSLNTKGILLRHGKPHNVKPDKYGYVRIAIRHKGKQHIIGEHRIVWLLVNNGWPSKSIDHIDRNRSNNHPINLRLATREQQLANSAGKNIRKNGITSKGVMRIDGNRKRPFVAKICGKHIGYFATEQEAADAYNVAAKNKWGEFAFQNTGIFSALNTPKRCILEC